MGKKRKLQHQNAPGKLGRPGRPGARPGKPARQRNESQKAANGPAKKGKGKQQQQQQQQRQAAERPTIPFEPHHRILLVGEGDLSFAASIVEHHGCANVTATVFEKDASELLAKYPHVEANIATIQGKKTEVTDKNESSTEVEKTEEPKNGQSADEVGGEASHDIASAQDDSDQDDQEGFSDDCYDSNDEDDDASNSSDSARRRQRYMRSLPRNNRLVYNIDATKLPASLTRTPYDRILFNFPHVGGKSTDVNRQVRYNQSLLVAFFERALPALAPGPDAAVVVTLFEGEPYTLWNVRDLARHAGLQVERSFRFQAAAYPGYRHARTLGVVRNAQGEATGGGWRGEERAARSYVFKRKGEVAAPGKKRRRGDDDDDSSDDDD